MNFRVGILLFVLSIAGLISCSKSGSSGSSDDGPHVINNNDLVPPVIEFTTPTEGQVFSNGSTISMTGKITDDNGLYRGTIRITNDATSGKVFEQPYEIHGLLLYNFNLSHVINVTTPTDFTVTASFEDHGQNLTTKSVKIKVNP